MSYEQKYLKYKQKYLELKSKLANINTETENNNVTTQYQLSDTPVNDMKGGDFYAFLNKNNNIENEINQRVNVINNQSVKNTQTENMVLTETPQAQDGGYDVDMNNLASFTPPKGPPPVVKPNGGIVNSVPSMNNASTIGEVAVVAANQSDNPAGFNQKDLGNKAVPVDKDVAVNDPASIDKAAPAESQTKYSVESPQMSDVENTTDIENIFKQLGGKRKSKKEIDDSSDIFGSSDSISIDDSNSSSDFSATPPVPSDTNPFEDSADNATASGSPGTGSPGTGSPFSA